MTTYKGVCGFFLSVKFATSLLALLAGGLNEENIYFAEDVQFLLAPSVQPVLR